MLLGGKIVGHFKRTNIVVKWNDTSKTYQALWEKWMLL
jgi:hypothetical protein